MIIKKYEAKKSSLGSVAFRFGFPDLGLGLNILGLGDHIPNCESVLKAVGLGRWLDLLVLALILELRTPLSPYSYQPLLGLQHQEKRLGWRGAALEEEE